jgi:nucleoside-diphosphate-sugar epimerase
MQPTATVSGQHILVTGGGGFVGGAIVKRLIDQGAKVRSLSRQYYPELSAAGVQQIQGDLQDAEIVSTACRGIDTVYHVAAKPGVWGPYDAYYRTNVIGTENIINACKRHQVAKLIYTSTPSVIFNGQDMVGVDESVPYADQYLTAYPATKAKAERLVRGASDTTLRTISLRPHLIWGPGDNHLVPRIIARAKRLAQVGNGTNLVDVTYIDNAADAHLLAATALEKLPNLGGKVYFISQGEPLPLWEMVNHILHAAGKPPVRRSVPKSVAYGIGAALEILYKMFHIQHEPPMTRFVAKELATTHWFNIQAARRDLGYAPRISTGEGLRRLADWLQSTKENNQ